jgi:hypothetical protein
MYAGRAQGERQDARAVLKQTMLFRLGTSLILTVLALAGAAALSEYQYAQAIWLLVTSIFIFGLWALPV